MPLPTHQQMLDAQAQFGPFDDIIMEQSARIAELETALRVIDDLAIEDNQTGTVCIGGEAFRAVIDRIQRTSASCDKLTTGTRVSSPGHEIADQGQTRQPGETGAANS